MRYFFKDLNISNEEFKMAIDKKGISVEELCNITNIDKITFLNFISFNYDLNYNNNIEGKTLSLEEIRKIEECLNINLLKTDSFNAYNNTIVSILDKIKLEKTKIDEDLDIMNKKSNKNINDFIKIEQLKSEALAFDKVISIISER